MKADPPYAFRDFRFPNPLEKLPASAILAAMQWLNRLEKIAAPIAVPGLIRIVAFLSSAAFIVGLAAPGVREYLPLDPAAVLRGEFWRILTFAFIPSTYSLFWIFALMFLFSIGDSLEEEIGATRLTLFYLIGWVAHVAAAFLLHTVATPLYLNLSLFLAYATLFPEASISLYMIIPVKVKWVALFAFAFAFATAGSLAGYAFLALGLGNYLLFFAPQLVQLLRTRNQIAQRRGEFREKVRPVEESLHRCKTCQRTENGHPDLDFRVSADGEEYCTEHLPSRV